MIVCSDGSALAIADMADYPDPPPSSSSEGQENLLSKAKGDELSSSIVESNESKQENVHGDHQYSIVQTSPNHSGIMPPILGSQLGPLENSESQACDIPQLPNVVVSLLSLVFTICSLVIYLCGSIYINFL